jgi:hypothetical protein
MGRYPVLWYNAPMNAEPNMNAYDLGQAAWHNGETVNPFNRAEQPEEYDDWFIGWRAAEADAEAWDFGPES